MRLASVFTKEGTNAGGTEERRLADINALIVQNCPKTAKDEDGVRTFVYNVAKEMRI